MSCISVQSWLARSHFKHSHSAAANCHTVRVWATSCGTGKGSVPNRTLWSAIFGELLYRSSSKSVNSRSRRYSPRVGSLTNCRNPALSQKAFNLSPSALLRLEYRSHLRWCMLMSPMMIVPKTSGLRTVHSFSSDSIVAASPASGGAVPHSD